MKKEAFRRNPFVIPIIPKPYYLFEPFLATAEGELAHLIRDGSTRSEISIIKEDANKEDINWIYSRPGC
jgi:hypothetical protein